MGDNPVVLALRELPMPVFTFDVWLTGLVALAIFLLLLAPLAYRGATPVRIAASPFAVIMLLNGLGHLAGSLYLRSWMPGGTTALLLLVTSVWLLMKVGRRSSNVG